MSIPPAPPLDETIAPGQSGHLADHEAIAAALNNAELVTTFDVRRFGVTFDGVTDDTAAWNAANAAAAAVGGGRLVGAEGDTAIFGVVAISPQVDVQLTGKWSSRFLCMAAGARVAFGTRTVDNRGGMSAGFTVDGNGIATQPLYIGLCVQRTFVDMRQINGAGAGGADGTGDAGTLIEAAQNNAFINVDFEDNDGHGVVFDYGAASNSFYVCERRNNGAAGGYNVVFRQTGTSPTGAPTTPTGNKFVGGVDDPPAAGANGNVLHGNGRDNMYDMADVSAAGRVADFSIFVIRRTDVTKPSTLFRVRSCGVSGAATFTRVFDVQGAANIVVEGHLFAENHKSLFYADDNANIEIAGTVSDVLTSGLTNLLENAGGGTSTATQLLRHRTRVTQKHEALSPTADYWAQVGVRGESGYRFQVRGDGQLQWTTDGVANASALSPGTAAGVACLLSSVPIKIGNTNAVIAAGAGVPTIAFADGSIWLRTDGGIGSSIYNRIGGAWVPGAATQAAVVAKTNDWTFALTDGGTVIEADKATALTGTIPLDTTVAFPIGTLIDIYQQGTGQVTIAAAGGVTLRAPGGAKTRVQFSTISLRKRATDEWIVYGDTAV